MKKLSEREEEIMSVLWNNGAMFVREIVELLPEPRPHFNTVATFLKGLESKGWVKKEMIGNANRYSAIKDVEAYRQNSLKNIISRFFGGSSFNLVSTLTRDSSISTDELRELINMVEKNK